MYKLFVKRTLDLIISLLGLPLFCLIYIIVAPIIKLTDKGPVFYSAERVGRNGKVYKMYKFRSMKVNAPDIRNADGSTYNSDNDSRVTGIGRVMRKTSIDETPQLLNVLKGEMSIIGPRPFVTTHYEGYDSLDDRRKKRLELRPGITGYSQAYYRNAIGMDEKIENDCYYVDNVTLLLDIKIFLKTVISVVKHENIFVSAEEVPAENTGREEVLNK